ncbi:hypothetical protein B0T10DRAFT_547264 [Thelonectria olida]|uniref:Uncharacterized protein n=1 Tax=Thelonectria olida TaxID=1576542 RepID=A0A9P8WAQ6_9HYPO|nr:hypothetical protein B0T10DRAFT_547264 [Thelonectria olida]
MGDASWTAIFVTADLPIEVINSVLEAATAEVYKGVISSELVENIWVLIQRRDQEILSKPTNAPVAPFESGFIGATPEELQEFVQRRFGENGVGKGSANYMDFLNDNAFAIIDGRTALDKTIQYWVPELVDGIQESAIRVAWNKGSELDETLSRFVMDEESHEDLIALARNAAPDGQNVDENDKERLKQQIEDWMTQEEEKPDSKWFEFTLSLETAVQCTYGIWHRGVVDLLTERDDFDENGVYH